MKFNIFSSMIHSGANTDKNRIHKGAGTANTKPAENNPKCKIIRIGGHKLRKTKSIERRLKDVKPDDRVVLEYNGNYCDYDWAAIASNPDGEHMPAVNFGQFRELYNYTLARIQTIGAKAALLTLPSLLPQRYFDHVSRNLNRKHIMHWIGDDVCNLNRWREEFNDEILSLASQHQVPLIDISKDLLQRSHIDDCYTDDGMHPNSTGQGVITEIVAEWNRSLS